MLVARAATSNVVITNNEVHSYLPRLHRCVYTYTCVAAVGVNTFCSKISVQAPPDRHSISFRNCACKLPPGGAVITGQIAGSADGCSNCQ